MSTRNTEDIIGALYDLVQDARNVPLKADMCMVERDKVLDMLDEIITNLPAELKQSRTIVESRNELISQARREAEAIIRQAEEKAETMVEQQAIIAEARRRTEEMVKQAYAKADQVTQAGNAYMDKKLRETEEVIARCMTEVKETRAKFQTLTGAANTAAE